MDKSEKPHAGARSGVGAVRSFLRNRADPEFLGHQNIRNAGLVGSPECFSFELRAVSFSPRHGSPPRALSPLYQVSTKPEQDQRADVVSQDERRLAAYFIRAMPAGPGDLCPRAAQNYCPARLRSISRWPLGHRISRLSAKLLMSHARALRGNSARTRRLVKQPLEDHEINKIHAPAAVQIRMRIG
jgi:hypothetical protein